MPVQPRVSIKFPGTTDGPGELPFTVGVLTDLSGPRAKQLRPLSQRVLYSVTGGLSPGMALCSRLEVETANYLGTGPTFWTEWQPCELADFDPANLAQTLDALRLAKTGRPAASDEQIARQLDAILRDPGLQRIEASWRGIDNVLKSAPPSLFRMLVLDISKAELQADLSTEGGIEESVVYQKLRREYDAWCGWPCHLLVADYEFGHDGDDLALLELLATLGARAHAPFLASAAPAMFGVKSFESLCGMRNLDSIFDANEYGRWRRFRATENARYLALVLPHVLLREPYPGRLGTRLWGNAAFALAARIVEAFGRSGWCEQFTGVAGGGLAQAVVDARLDEKQECELFHAGFATLLSSFEGNSAAFFGVPSCHCQARLSDTLAPLRFVHYLRMLANFRRQSSSARECERELNDWIAGYVNSDEDAPDDAWRPLAAAVVSLSPSPQHPGTSVLSVRLKPSFQASGCAPELHVTAVLP